MGQLTIPRLTALQNYWKQNPPVHLLVKWFLKYEYKPRPEVDESQSNESGFAELFAMFPEGKI